MTTFKKFTMLICIICIAVTTPAQEVDEFLPLYLDSTVRYDDKIGFEELSFPVSKESLLTLDGTLRRVFCRAPEGRSPLEIIRNYEKAIQERGGAVLFLSRSPKDIEIEGRKFKDIFSQKRQERGLATSHYTHTAFPDEVSEYLAGKLSTPEKDVYLIIAAGKGAWAASEHQRTFFELITLLVEPMQTGLVSLTAIEDGLSAQGRIAVYDIFFDTGKSELKAESGQALKTIAEYLNKNRDKKVLVVGHTDSSGDFDRNITLSLERAQAVIEKLVSEYGVSAGQLKPYGIGPVSPLASNATEKGRALNRRVEIVEQ